MARKRNGKSLATERVLSRFIDWAAQSPEGAGQYSAHSLVHLTRVRLGMTQAQLARRSGLTQSHIANIENGKVDVQLTTLRRVFKALHCDLVLAPRPEGDLEEFIRHQARKTAMNRVRRVTGTMALEDQRPEEGMIEDLVRAETEKLLRARSAEIWEIE